MSSATTSATISEKERPKEKKEVKLRARRFMMEINQLEKYEQIKKNLMSRRTFRYLVSGKEVAPETGKEHIHLYVEFKQSTVLTPKTLCNCHADVVKSKDQAIDYCTKDCEIVDEIGKETHQGAKTVGEYIKMKDPTDLDPHLFKTWCQVKQWDQSHTKSEYYCPQKQVYYIWGDSCVGKSHFIYDQLTEDERIDRVSYKNGFWAGVSMNPDVKVAWYDDFRDSHMHPSELISFCDYYRNQLNVKGTTILNHYDKIFITSVQDPHEIYPNMKDEEPKAQWLRRIKITHREALK